MSSPGDRIASVRDALRTVAAICSPTDVTWLVGGSTATVLHGVDLVAPPRDLDIDAPGKSAERLGTLLSQYTVEPLQYSATALYRNLFGRYEIAGVKVEVIGDLIINASTWSHHFRITPALYERCRRVEVQPGLSVRLVPLEHQLIVNLIRGRKERVALIAAFLRKQGGPNLDYLEEVYRVDRVPGVTREMIDRLCRP